VKLDVPREGLPSRILEIIKASLARATELHVKVPATPAAQKSFRAAFRSLVGTQSLRKLTFDARSCADRLTANLLKHRLLDQTNLEVAILPTYVDLWTSERDSARLSGLDTEPERWPLGMKLAIDITKLDKGGENTKRLSFHTDAQVSLLDEMMEQGYEAAAMAIQGVHAPTRLGTTEFGAFKNLNWKPTTHLTKLRLVELDLQDLPTSKFNIDFSALLFLELRRCQDGSFLRWMEHD
jgi:hypothetical protein